VLWIAQCPEPYVQQWGSSKGEAIERVRTYLMNHYGITQAEAVPFEEGVEVLDQRGKIALENIASLQKSVEKLTPWEQEFIFSICENGIQSLTRKQFNKLHEIAVDVRKRP
jgi:hypothetical protein